MPEHTTELDAAHDDAAPAELTTEARNQMYARLGYLFVYFALAACTPYYSRMLSSKGMSSRWIGVLMAVQPLSILFLLPPLSHLADKFHCADRMLIVCGVASCAALLSATGLPLPLGLLSFAMIIHFCSICTFTAFFDQRVLSTLTEAQKAEWGATRCFGSVGWGVMAPVSSILVDITGWWVVGLLYTVFYAAAMWCYQRLAPCPLAEARAPHVLASSENETSPQQRVKPDEREGQLAQGRGVEKPLTGVVAARVEVFPGDMLPLPAIDEAMGYSASVREGVHVVSPPATFTAEGHVESHAVSTAAGEVTPMVSEKASFAHIIALICTRRRVLFVLLYQCIGGAGYTIITTYLFLFLDTLKSPSWLYGIAVTMTVVVEIPLFRISDVLHERLSDRHMLILALVGWSLRTMGYALLPATAPWMVLCLEPLHGLSFGFLWLSGVHFITRAFPPSLSASSIGFLNAATFGVGPVVGNVAGGWLYDTVGPRALFGGGGLVMMALVALYAGLDMMWEKKGYSTVISEDGVTEQLSE